MTAALLEVSDLRVRFAGEVEALHGEAVGVVGPSGSGKTTLARILARQLHPDSGEVRVGGAQAPARRDARAPRARVQLVMQDPWEPLSPRLRVAELVRKVTDRIVVLDGGRVVEEGSSQRIGASPSSETARRLVASAPTLEVGEP